MVIYHNAEARISAPAGGVSLIGLFRLALVVSVVRARMRIRRALVSFGYDWRSAWLVWGGLLTGVVLLAVGSFALGRALSGANTVAPPQVVMLVASLWVLGNASQPMRLYRTLFVTSSRVFLEQFRIMRKAVLVAHLLVRMAIPACLTVAVFLPLVVGSGGFTGVTSMLVLGLLLVLTTLLAELVSIAVAGSLGRRLRTATAIRLVVLSLAFFAIPSLVVRLIFPTGEVVIPDLPFDRLERFAQLLSSSPLWWLCLLGLVVACGAVAAFALPRAMGSFQSAGDPAPRARRIAPTFRRLVGDDRPFLAKDLLHLARSDYLAASSIASRVTLFSAFLLGSLFALRHFTVVPAAIVVAAACSVLFFAKDLLADCILLPIVAIEHDLAAAHLFWKKDFTVWQVLREKWFLFIVLLLLLVPLDLAVLWLVSQNLPHAVLLTVLLFSSGFLWQLITVGVSAIFFQPDCERAAEAGHSQKADTVAVLCTAPLMMMFGGTLWFLLGRSDGLLLQLAVVSGFFVAAAGISLLIVRYLSVIRLSEINVY